MISFPAFAVDDGEKVEETRDSIVNKLEVQLYSLITSHRMGVLCQLSITVDRYSLFFMHRLKYFTFTFKLAFEYMNKSILTYMIIRKLAQGLYCT